MGGFSKVTHFLRDTLLTPDRQDLTADIGSDVTDGLLSRYTPNVNATVTCSTETHGEFEIVTAVSCLWVLGCVVNYDLSLWLSKHLFQLAILEGVRADCAVFVTCP
jgi:hypothetical protein